MIRLTLLIALWFVMASGISSLSILIQGWMTQPHSFAIVNCFQILGILSSFDGVKIFYSETQFFYKKERPPPVNETLMTLFRPSYQSVLNKIQVWNEEHVDVIYRIHFPLDITHKAIFDTKYPIILFYAATRSVFTYSELYSESMRGMNGSTMHELFDKKRIESTLQEEIREMPENVYFVTPSPGSAHAMKNLMAPERFRSHHRVIPHGVDLSVFYNTFNTAARHATRANYGIGPHDIVFLHIGAMVSTKGIDNMLLMMASLKMNPHLGSFKLILKGLESVYASESLLRERFDVIADQKILTIEAMESLLESSILFTGATLSFEDMNDLLNAADAYLAPYVSEAFNMPLLEAIATGIPVFVSTNGSATYYIDHILANVPGAENRIFTLSPEIYLFHEYNYFECKSSVLVYSIISHLSQVKQPLSKYYYYSLQSFLFQHYSWNAVAEQLVNMMDEVLWRQQQQQKQQQ